MKKIMAILLLVSMVARAMETQVSQASYKNQFTLFDNLTDQDRGDFASQFQHMRGFHLFVPQMRSLYKTALEYSTLNCAQLYLLKKSDETSFQNIVTCAQEKIIEALAGNYPKKNFFTHVKALQQLISQKFNEEIASKPVVTIGYSHDSYNELISLSAKCYLAAEHFDDVVHTDFKDAWRLHHPISQYVEHELLEKYSPAFTNDAAKRKIWESAVARFQLAK